MDIIDMFIHPVAHAAEADLLDLSKLDWADWTQTTISTMDQLCVSASGVCVMDDSILDRPQDLAALAAATATQRCWFSLMPDFRHPSALKRVEASAAAGFRALTFHSYLQEITVADYPRVIEIASLAESLGMFTGLCSAYGSKRLYDYHSLPLAAELAKNLSGPILLYHNGGSRVLEAMLMCEMWPNLYLETSFSLSYWLGSSVETDLAFTIKKIGAQRVMFGSDAPFLALSVALHDHQAFFQRHGFTAREQALILGDSARTLFPFLPRS